MILKLYVTTVIAKVFIAFMRFAELSSVFRIACTIFLFFLSLLRVEFRYSHQCQDICTLPVQGF